MLLSMLISLAALLLGLSQAQEPDCICLEELDAAAGLRSPTTFAFSPDGTGRKFIAEQIGVVRILDANDNLLPDLFIDLTQTVLSGGEQGFLAITFHPDFVNNRRVFIYYSVTLEDGGYTRLSEILVSATNPNVVDYGTERALLEVFQPFTNHNGGDLVFAMDGFLYLGLGDGGFAGDPFDYGQDLTTLLGKVIRIDVDVGTAPFEYGIPADNPFVGDATALDEIYAYGLRNPWRLGLDLGDPVTQAGRGRIFVADVGQDAWEEIDLLEAGGNYAWRCKEGFEIFNLENCPAEIPNEVLPILTYDHETTGQSVTGGYVYRGTENPALSGWYIFADYMTKRLFRMVEPTSGQYEWKEIFTCSTSCTANGLVDDFGVFVQAFGQSPEGEVYFVTNDEYSVNLPVGRAFKIVQDPTLQK